MAPYERIVAELRRRIHDGELRPGQRVPSTRAITREWGVAMATATKVLTALRQEGLVHAVPGVGTVVAAAPPPRPAPVKGETHTRERIVRAATEIADVEGLAALTMRRVATELGVATMSLYRHVRSKEELVALMADAAFAEERLPEPPDGWRATLKVAATTQWRLYGRHPWLAQTMSLNRPLLAPNAMLHIEWILRALDGLDDDTRMHAAITLFGYVRGSAIDLETETQVIQETGVSGEQWLDEHDDQVAAAVASLATFAAIRKRPGVDVSMRSLFEFGLERFLDGLATLID